MNKRILWLTVSSLMALSLVLAACGQASAPVAPSAPAAPISPAAPAPAAPTAKPAAEPAQKAPAAPVAEQPKYGGTLNLYAGDPTDWEWNQTVNYELLYDHLWGADWTKGAAGGYGSNKTDWTNNYDDFDTYQGWAATSWAWTINPQTNEATIVYKITPGLHYYVIPGNAASALVNGREMTSDDIVYTLKWEFEPGKARYGYTSIPEMRNLDAAKTGQWEVTVKLASAEQVMPALTNLNGKRWPIRPPEIVQKYGSFNAWDRQIGTGPFMLKEYVPASSATMVKNPSYWAKDPIGPGKGNQLPYIDGVKYLIIPDLSTRYAALRTGKLDQLFGLNLDDSSQMRQTAPRLKEMQYYNFTSVPGATYMRIDISPTSDIRVRRAIMMATDFESIKQSVNRGQGEVITFPTMPNKGYAALYIGLNDPDLPPDVKELYSFKPDKAKQLLKEAGYPNGFKVQVLATSAAADYLSIYKDMWSKVGIDLDIMIRDAGVINSLVSGGSNPPLTVGITSSVGRFYQSEVITGEGVQNLANIRKDPTIEAALSKIRTLALTDMQGSEKLFRNLTRDYILGQAYAVPTPMAQHSVFWWPWIKGYSGETILPIGVYNRWSEWIWLDQDLKKSMGH